MKAEITYTEQLYDIERLIGNIPKEIQGNEKTVLKEMAVVVKKNVEKNLSYSDVEKRAKQIKPKNYDGSRPYVHMKDDVKYTVRKDKNGDLYAKIQGGKYTGFKWRFLNDGTVDSKGRRHTKATRFIDKGLQESEDEIEAIIDRYIKAVI